MKVSLCPLKQQVQWNIGNAFSFPRKISYASSLFVNGSCAPYLCAPIIQLLAITFLKWLWKNISILVVVSLIHLIISLNRFLNPLCSHLNQACTWLMFFLIVLHLLMLALVSMQIPGLVGLVSCCPSCLLSWEGYHGNQTNCNQIHHP